MKRILFASPYGGIQGGISRWTEHILNYYKSNPSDYQLDLLPMGRSTFVNIGASLFYRIKTAIKDYRIILNDYNTKLKTNKYDIVHLSSSASISLIKDLYMLRAAKKLGLKTIIHFHFGRIPDLKEANNWEWKMLCWVVKLADQVIVMDKKSYEALLNSNFTNITLLPNPVAPKVLEIVNEKKEIIKREPRTILFVGHVAPTKGIFELLAACKQISNITLSYVGHVEPDIKQALIKESDNASWLKIYGEKEYTKVVEDMLKCDLFILPTYTEGFPNVILESMACGCAIITTSVGAIPEMLTPNDNINYGIVLPPKDIIALKEAINKMLLDTPFKRECQINAQNRVNSEYNISNIWKQLSTIWNNL